MKCKQAHEYTHIKCNQSKFMSLLPLLVFFSCPRILIHLFSLMLLPLCPCPCPTSTSLSQSLPKLFISLYNISPFVINFHKRCSSYWYKGLHWGRWLILESCTFDGHHHMCWNDTTCIALETPHVGSFWPWYQLVGHLPLSHFMGHPFDKLELLYVRELSSLDHLKLRITCETTILYDWYQV